MPQGQAQGQSQKRQSPLRQKQKEEKPEQETSQHDQEGGTMKRFWVLLALALCLGALGAAPASAQFGLKELEVTFEDEAENPILEAGAHPFQMSTNLGFNTFSTPEGDVPEGDVRNITITQIPGLIGSQTAVETCSEVDFNTRVETRPMCPDETAVGYAAVEAEFEVIPPEDSGPRIHVPVYNVDPPPGVAATLGFIVLNVPVTIDVRVSPAPPYNLVAELRDISQAVLIYRSDVVLWGNPASDAHNELRGKCLGNVEIPTEDPVSECVSDVDIPERAFLTLPRACGEPLPTLFEATSWQKEFAEGTAFTHDGTEPKGIQGCETLEFDPEKTAISAQPTTSQGSSATGLDFGLNVDDPGLTDPSQRAQSDIAEVAALLPEGMALNPSAANGLGACTLAQYNEEGLQWNPNAGCPQSSKVGEVEVETPLLKEPVTGDLYVAAQNDNPFNSLFALYMVIRNERYGVLIKQAGEVEPDPETGQLATYFEEIPQLPFADFQLRFNEGPRAPLTTPPDCGTHTALALLFPWSEGEPIVESSSFEVTSGPNGGPCRSGDGPFSPSLTAGATNTQAGAYTPFYMRITRGDGEQEITRFDSVLPQGVVGKIAGLGRCSDAAIAASENRSGRAEIADPSCPASARIGSIESGAGVGPFPTYVDGSLYLAGPYDGNPLSIVAITPAVAGPFDLGTVAIREGLKLNPTTAEVEVSGAGPEGLIPRLLEGVPLQVRDLRIKIDRPEFTLNATSCEPKTIRATIFGTSSSASPTDRYQATGCGALGYKPKLTLKLLGARKRGQFPRVQATLVPRPGDANTASTVVTLPPSQQIENAHINNPCTRVQFNDNACPKSSILGKARAFSPLLDEPLEGPVYFRSNGGERELPDLVADLNGQFRIILVGFIDTKGKRIRTTFANVPDAPVSRFELNLSGGKKGLLVNNRNICAKKQRAKLRMIAHNGRPFVTNQVIKTSCKGKKGGKAKSGRRR
jgi:hypothetical protein